MLGAPQPLPQARWGMKSLRPPVPVGPLPEGSTNASSAQLRARAVVQRSICTMDGHQGREEYGLSTSVALSAAGDMQMAFSHGRSRGPHLPCGCTGEARPARVSVGLAL